MSVLPPCPQSWNVLALDGSNWQRIDLFDFQRDIEVSKSDLHVFIFPVTSVFAA